MPGITDDRIDPDGREVAFHKSFFFECLRGFPGAFLFDCLENFHYIYRPVVSGTA